MQKEIKKLLEEYELKTDWCACGYDFEKDCYEITFKYPYKEQTFNTYEELETILKERKQYYEQRKEINR